MSHDVETRLEDGKLYVSRAYVAPREAVFDAWRGDIEMHDIIRGGWTAAFGKLAGFLETSSAAS